MTLLSNQIAVNAGRLGSFFDHNSNRHLRHYILRDHNVPDRYSLSAQIQMLHSQMLQFISEIPEGRSPALRTALALRLKKVIEDPFRQKLGGDLKTIVDTIQYIARRSIALHQASLVGPDENDWELARGIEEDAQQYTAMLLRGKDESVIFRLSSRLEGVQSIIQTIYKKDLKEWVSRLDVYDASIFLVFPALLEANLIQNSASYETYRGISPNTQIDSKEYETLKKNSFDELTNIVAKDFTEEFSDPILQKLKLSASAKRQENERLILLGLKHYASIAEKLFAQIDCLSSQDLQSEIERAKKIESIGFIVNVLNNPNAINKLGKKTINDMVVWLSARGRFPEKIFQERRLDITTETLFQAVAKADKWGHREVLHRLIDGMDVELRPQLLLFSVQEGSVEAISKLFKGELTDDLKREIPKIFCRIPSIFHDMFEEDLETKILQLFCSPEIMKYISEQDVECVFVNFCNQLDVDKLSYLIPYLPKKIPNSIRQSLVEVSSSVCHPTNIKWVGYLLREEIFNLLNEESRGEVLESLNVLLLRVEGDELVEIFRQFESSPFFDVIDSTPDPEYQAHKSHRTELSAMLADSVINIELFKLLLDSRRGEEIEQQDFEWALSKLNVWREGVLELIDHPRYQKFSPGFLEKLLLIKEIPPEFVVKVLNKEDREHPIVLDEKRFKRFVCRAAEFGDVQALEFFKKRNPELFQQVAQDAELIATEKKKFEAAGYLWSEIRKTLELKNKRSLLLIKRPLSKRRKIGFHEKQKT